MKFTLAQAALLGLISAQQVDNQKTEFHPPLQISNCTVKDGCQAVQKTLTMDAKWRETRTTGGDALCYSGTSWNTTHCPDPVTCAKNCALSGIDKNDFVNTYGVTAEGNSLRLNLVT